MSGSIQRRLRCSPAAHHRRIEIEVSISEVRDEADLGECAVVRTMVNLRPWQLILPASAAVVWDEAGIF